MTDSEEKIYLLKGEHLFTTIYNGDKEIKLLDEHTAFIEDFGPIIATTIVCPISKVFQELSIQLSLWKFTLFNSRLCVYSVLFKSVVITL